MEKWQARVGLLGVAIIWAFGYIATDESLKYISITQMQVFRFGITVILLCIIFHKRLKKITKKTVVYGVLLGIIFFLAMTIHSEALTSTTVSKNAFLVVLNVIFVPIIMYFTFKVKIKPYLVFGVIMMLIGFFILIFNIDLLDISNSLASLKNESKITKGDIQTIVSSIIFALQIVMIGYFVSKDDPINLVIIELACASIFSLIYCLITNQPVFTINSDLIIKALPAILYLGISGCIGFAGQLVIQQYLSASNVAIIFSTESLFATVFSVILGIEPFTNGLLPGAIIITTGIILAETGFNFKEK